MKKYTTQQSAKNLIFNADDFGRNINVSKAIDYCFKKNIISRTTIMVNMPDCLYAVKLAKKHNYCNKVGLHLNLVEGEPILEDTKKSFLCTNGVFNGVILKSRYHFFITNKEKFALQNEVRAQIIKYHELGFDLNHVDSHHHVHTKLMVLLSIIPILKENGVSSIRITRNVFRSKTSVLRKIYIYICNKLIIKKYFPLQSDNLFFTSLDSYTNENMRNGIVEIMLHPDLNDNMIFDIPSGIILARE